MKVQTVTTLRLDDEYLRAKRKVSPPIPAGDFILSFKEWCRVNRFSERTGRRILASGHGPKTLQLSERRIGIREIDNAAWQESRVR